MKINGFTVKRAQMWSSLNSSSPNWPRRTEVPMFFFSERHESVYFSRWARVQAQAAAEMLSSVYQVLKFPFPPRRRDTLLNNEREPHHSDYDWYFGLCLRLNKAEQVLNSVPVSFQSIRVVVEVIPPGSLGRRTSGWDIGLIRLFYVHGLGENWLFWL